MDKIIGKSANKIENLLKFVENKISITENERKVPIDKNNICNI